MTGSKADALLVGAWPAAGSPTLPQGPRPPRDGPRDREIVHLGTDHSGARARRSGTGTGGPRAPRRRRAPGGAGRSPENVRRRRSCAARNCSSKRERAACRAALDATPRAADPRGPQPCGKRLPGCDRRGGRPHQRGRTKGPGRPRGGDCGDGEWASPRGECRGRTKDPGARRPVSERQAPTCVGRPPDGVGEEQPASRLPERTLRVVSLPRATGPTQTRRGSVRALSTEPRRPRQLRLVSVSQRLGTLDRPRRYADNGRAGGNVVRHDGAGSDERA